MGMTIDDEREMRANGITNVEIKHIKQLYEARLKADLEAILVELQLEIEEKVHSYHSRYCPACEAVDRKSVSNLIQEKIDKLKENDNG